MTAHPLLIGLDVGSTTVKAVVVDPATDKTLWSDYQRHETKQPEKVLEFLERIEAAFPGESPSRFRVFITGSGGTTIGRRIGAKFVQEVNAVSLAVEKLYPHANSVVELGGQDAKIIVFKEDEATGRKKKIPSMNDKCAGGTGAVIDKINAKLRIPAVELCKMGYDGLKLHPVAGKCGVFAETDINGLQKQGVPPSELMASLFEAIVQQNLSVLTRGNTLKPYVLLLGGPNTYIRGMLEAWRENIPKVWAERKTPLPAGKDPKELIIVPENAQYFAALGAVLFGKDEDANVGVYGGTAGLRHYLTAGRAEEKAKKSAGGGLAKNAEELDAFKARYARETWRNKTFRPGERVEAFIGIDGGSTSTKAVLMDADRNVLVKSYQLSKGNPIQDTVEVLGKLREHVEACGAALDVLGVGTTGYAKDILRDVLAADVALVETVAHTESALRFYPDADVICDVGGQDIKVIILKNGKVKDFRLNTQCSAGNGYFLQGTAETFGYTVAEFADAAFAARTMPSFGYGCAVFMQSDIVDFQRQGWAPAEIMAGLADVLPKNIWLYVCQMPNLAKLGTHFVLQGGTQNNLAAVKSQVDFIEKRFVGQSAKPRVTVHAHCGESGAIGAAIEAVRLYGNGRRTSFIGLDAVPTIRYSTTRSEDTRCYFCKNKCLRTFIDFHAASGPKVALPLHAPLSPGVRGAGGDGEGSAPANAPSPRPSPSEGRGEQTFKSKVPLAEGAKRLIIATCEKGEVEDLNAMRGIKKGLDAVKKANPNIADLAAHEAFAAQNPPRVADPEPVAGWFNRAEVEKRLALMRRRKDVVIGMPRVLNMYSLAPFFSAYFESLGVPAGNLVYSDYTSDELYKEGSKRGSIDPCFPSKVANSHVHNLVYRKHPKRKLDYIFFPMIDAFPTFLKATMDQRSCPTVTATPAAVKAAFTKEANVFAENGIRYLDTFLHMDEPELTARQLHAEFADKLGLSVEENLRAVAEGYAALERFNNRFRRLSREVIDALEAEDRIGVVLLARPYHNDPGLNHDILEEFQKLGYPVLTQDFLPLDEDILERLFGDEVRAGEIPSPLAITDVWKNAYSENTNRKVWAAKYTARHPNLVALELSSFKCGHDAPIYSVVEEIIESSGTPYFCFKDIDENKPTGSIKIRTETIAYFLKRYREDLVRRKAKRAEVEARLREYEAQLRREMGLVGAPGA
jgi:predicted CoA-substrate-specific enzyme activase